MSRLKDHEAGMCPAEFINTEENFQLRHRNRISALTISVENIKY